MRAIDKGLLYASLAVTASIAGIGAFTLLTEPVTTWGGASLAVSLSLLIGAAAAVWRWRNSFFSLVAFLYAAVLSGRLFSTLRLPEDLVATGGAALDPLLLGETGPGVPSIMWLSYALVALITVQLVRFALRSTSHDSSTLAPTLNEWTLTSLRVYVGLMFIAHYSGHVLAGPDQFQIFADYFATVGLQIGAPMVVLAGLIEIAVSIGLVFGLVTRGAALGGALYLFLATLWGDHFAAGYVWVLPTGGWEFSALWMFCVLIFAVVGPGRLTIDEKLRSAVPTKFSWAIR